LESPSLLQKLQGQVSALEQQVQTLEHRKCNHEDLKLLQARTAKIQKELGSLRQQADKNKEKCK
jgi:hypothetical protein